MREIQVAHCFGDVAWFLGIEVAGFTFADGTEPAMTRADVAAEHERRRPIIPALEDVRTTRFLTNSVQVQALDQFEHLVLIGRIAKADAQPFGLWLTNLLIITDYA